MKLEKHICKKVNHKFPQINIGEVFVNLIMHDFMTPLNKFSNFVLVRLV